MKNKSIALIGFCFVVVLGMMLPRIGSASNEEDSFRRLRNVSSEKFRKAATSMRNQQSAASCKRLCDPSNPSPLCLIVSTIDADRDRQLAVLASWVLKAPPLLIEQNRVIELFKIESSEYLARRSSTVVDEAGELRNFGEASSVSAVSQNGFRIRIEFPSKIAYRFSFSGGEALLHAVDSSGAIAIVFDDAILDSTYGGLVSELSVDAGRAIFATYAGCISYVFDGSIGLIRQAKLLDQIVSRRLALEKVSGASSSWMDSVRSSYGRISPLVRCFGWGCEDKKDCTYFQQPPQHICYAGEFTDRICRGAYAYICNTDPRPLVTKFSYTSTYGGLTNRVVDGPVTVPADATVKNGKAFKLGGSVFMSSGLCYERNFSLER